MKPFVERPDLPRAFRFAGADADAALAVRPLGLLHGAAGAAARGTGDGRPLAGGAATFTSCQLFLTGVDAVHVCVAPLRAVEAWARRAGAGVEDALSRAFDRLSAARAPFAGLPLDRPRIVGVVNVTPDSFSDGGDHSDPGAAIAHGRALAAAGADIVEVGGESTRPGAAPVAAEVELDRVLPVLRGLAGCGAPLSIDTRRAAVMRAALAAGAAIVNDVSALGDAGAPAAVAAHAAHVVLMHKQGEPRDMQAAPAYGHAFHDVLGYLRARVAACERAGVPRARIAVDPGIGFGKTDRHNALLLSSVAGFHGLGCAVAVGASRKSFIARLSAGEPPKGRLPGSLAAAALALAQGVQLLRAHDVAATRQAASVLAALLSA